MAQVMRESEEEKSSCG